LLGRVRLLNPERRARARRVDRRPAFGIAPQWRRTAAPRAPSSALLPRRIMGVLVAAAGGAAPAVQSRMARGGGASGGAPRRSGLRAPRAAKRRRAHRD